MHIYKNYQLQLHLTSRIETTALAYIVLESADEIPAAREATQSEANPLGIPDHILGGGSNIIPTTPQLGTIWHPWWCDWSIQDESESDITLRVGAGMGRDTLVRETIAHGRRGIENLIAIPGCVGAAPIQNIGAYGVEVKDVIVSCDIYDFTTGEYSTIPADECAFAYRDSIFKRMSGRYLICYVTIQLLKTEKPVLTYAPVVQALEQSWPIPVTQHRIAETIETIRRSKLPKPDTYGNVGSFFKNPHVSWSVIEHIRQTFPDVPHYPTNDGNYKVPAARLIEQAGLKGIRHDAVGTFPLQPLVIVNYGGGSWQQFITFARFIIHHVHKKFGVSLEPEAQFWD